MSSALATCTRCGTPLDEAALGGLCPRCVALDFFSPSPAEGAETAIPPLDESERRVGDYELLEEIARGGMGVVYRARQLSLNREVAVKMILHGVLAGDTAIARLKAEANAVAGLRHPNIVAIHEIGEHQGRHFFSMEFVRGRTLAELVREGPLSARHAATYLERIAEAVHYAHGRGILHRDLKPSNVLIDEHDQPRVTDFGLAKRFEGDSDLTLTGQVLGTPAYMSPEQAGAARFGAVGARSDVYSMGAVLYHLVTGRAPFTGATATEILRQVTDAEPVAPRLLNPSLPRDLETICIKCLGKEPSRRYASAAELTDDLGRFLRDEPIHARPISPPERLWRWCRRKPALASALAACAVILVGGLGGILWQLQQKEAARQRAEANEEKAKTEAARSTQVAKFMREMLDGVGPKVALGRDTKLLREILDRTAQRVRDELMEQPEVAADLRETLGAVYLAIGDYKAAEAMHREALALRKKLFGNEHHLVAKSLTDLGGAFIEQGRFAEAEPLMREALALRRKLGDEGPVADSLYTLAWVLMNLGKQPEAEAHVRESLAMQKKHLKPEHPLIAVPLNLLGHLLQQQGKYAESEDVLRETLALRRKALPVDHPDLAETLDALGNTLMSGGKLDEAESAIREALEIREKVLGHEHTMVGRSLFRLGILRERQHQLAEAGEFYRESAAIYARRGDITFGRAGVLDALGALLTQQGRAAEAEPLQREALALYEKLGPAYRGQANAQLHLADTLRAQKKFAEAETLLLNRHAESIRDTNQSWQIRLVVTNLFRLYSEWGKPDQAADWKRKLAEFEPPPKP